MILFKMEELEFDEKLVEEIDELGEFGDDLFFDLDLYDVDEMDWEPSFKRPRGRGRGWSRGRGRGRGRGRAKMGGRGEMQSTSFSDKIDYWDLDDDIDPEGQRSHGYWREDKMFSGRGRRQLSDKHGGRESDSRWNRDRDGRKYEDGSGSEERVVYSTSKRDQRPTEEELKVHFSQRSDPRQNHLESKEQKHKEEKDSEGSGGISKRDGKLLTTDAAELSKSREGLKKEPNLLSSLSEAIKKVNIRIANTQAKLKEKVQEIDAGPKSLDLDLEVENKTTIQKGTKGISGKPQTSPIHDKDESWQNKGQSGSFDSERSPTRKVFYDSESRRRISPPPHEGREHRRSPHRWHYNRSPHSHERSRSRERSHSRERSRSRDRSRSQEQARRSSYSPRRRYSHSSNRSYSPREKRNASPRSRSGSPRNRSRSPPRKRSPLLRSRPSRQGLMPRPPNYTSSVAPRSGYSATLPYPQTAPIIPAPYGAAGQAPYPGYQQYDYYQQQNQQQQQQQQQPQPPYSLEYHGQAPSHSWPEPGTMYDVNSQQQMPVPPAGDPTQALPPATVSVRPHGAVEATPEAMEEAKQEAIKNEILQQKQALSKQREEYIKKKSVMFCELQLLRNQEDELKQEKSRDNDRILRENNKLQVEIQNKLKAVDNVIDMLTGIIGDVHRTKLEKEEKPSKKRAASPPPKLQSPPPVEVKQRKGAPAKLESPLLPPGVERADDASGKPVYNYVYYDPEMHWCHLCDVFPRTAKEFLNHLHSPEHRQTAADRKLVELPWHDSMPEKPVPTHEGAPVKRTPIRGLQFFVSATAWFCKLCSVWIGDLHCASLHLKSKVHAEKYSNFTEQNPHWETDWMADREKAYERARKMKDSELSNPAEGYKGKVKSEKREPTADKERKQKKSKSRKSSSSSSSSSSSCSSSDSEQDDAEKSRSIHVAMRNKQKVVAKEIAGGVTMPKSRWDSPVKEEVETDREEPPTPSRSSHDQSMAKLSAEDKMLKEWMSKNVMPEGMKRMAIDLKDRLKQRQDKLYDESSKYHHGFYIRNIEKPQIHRKMNRWDRERFDKQVHSERNLSKEAKKGSKIGKSFENKTPDRRESRKEEKKEGKKEIEKKDMKKEVKKESYKKEEKKVSEMKKMEAKNPLVANYTDVEKNESDEKQGSEKKFKEFKVPFPVSGKSKLPFIGRMPILKSLKKKPQGEMKAVIDSSNTDSANTVGVTDPSSITAPIITLPSSNPPSPPKLTARMFEKKENAKGIDGQTFSLAFNKLPVVVEKQAGGSTPASSPPSARDAILPKKLGTAQGGQFPGVQTNVTGIGSWQLVRQQGNFPPLQQQAHNSGPPQQSERDPSGQWPGFSAAPPHMGKLPATMNTLVYNQPQPPVMNAPVFNQPQAPMYNQPQHPPAGNAPVFNQPGQEPGMAYMSGPPDHQMMRGLGPGPDPRQFGQRPGPYFGAGPSGPPQQLMQRPSGPPQQLMQRPSGPMPFGQGGQQHVFRPPSEPPPAELAPPRKITPPYIMASTKPKGIEKSREMEKAKIAAVVEAAKKIEATIKVEEAKKAAEAARQVAVKAEAQKAADAKKQNDDDLAMLGIDASDMAAQSLNQTAETKKK